MRHPEIGDHRGEGPPLVQLGPQGVDARLTAGCAGDGVTVRLQQVAQRLQNQGVVIDQEDASARRRTPISASRV